MCNVNRILVPVDFSACSWAALKYAVELADRFDAEIDVLHVWEPPTYNIPELMMHVPGTTGLSVEQYAREQARKQTDEFVSLLKQRTRRPVHSRTDVGVPAERILDVACEGHYDLIVMGTHGRTGLSHMVMGSVAERVVRRADCPVLTIRLPRRAAAEKGVGT